MTQKSEIWKSDKTLDCESVSTKSFWYTKGEFKEATELPTPHIKSILEFMYKRADYKRNIAIGVMECPVDKWKTPYYKNTAESDILYYCRQHFPAYKTFYDTLIVRHSKMPYPKEFGIDNESPFRSDPESPEDVGKNVNIDKVEARLKKLEDIIYSNYIYGLKSRTER